MNWSFKLFRIFGIPVRIHWTLPFFMVGEVIAVLARAGAETLKYTAGMMGLLFIQVLTHELGHCWGARRIGEEADQIVLWPLGGMAYVGHSDDPRRDWIITAAGPAVTVFWGVASAAALLMMGYSVSLEALNPFGSWWPEGAVDYATVMLVLNLKMSVVLAAFNLLVPAYPLDGCRLLMAWLTLRIGPGPAMRTTAIIAIPTGILIVLLGFWQGSLLTLLLGIWVTMQSIGLYGQASQAGEYGEASYSDRGYVIREEKRKEGFFERRRRLRRERELARRAEEEVALRKVVDQLLEKVSRSGMESLTPAERRKLEEASARLRRND